MVNPRKYRVTLYVVVKEGWASLEDFRREIEQFNASNKDVIEVEIKNYQLLKPKGRGRG
jgi:hypothetical protein